MIIGLMFQLWTTMQGRGSSLLLWEATAIRIDLAQLGFPYHTTYASPGPTYINPHSDPPEREPVCATREYSTPPPYAIPDGFTWWVHATLTISHSQCAVVFSHNGIAKVSGLLEYVIGTAKSRPQAALQWSILNRHRQSTPLRLHSRCKPPARSQFKFITNIKPQGLPRV